MNLSFLNTEKSLALLQEKLVSWYELLIKSLPNIVVAIVVFFIFIGLAKFTKYICESFASRFITNKSLLGLITTCISIIVTLVGLFTALEILNLNKTVTSLLAGAGVLGLALGFAFQEIAANFVSGIFIAAKRPYRIGDIVKTKEFLGEVKDIHLRTTIIRTFDGLEAIVPNKSMFTEALINLTSTPDRRIDLNVGVSYSDNLENVISVVKAALEGTEHRIKNKKIEVFFEEFGDSSINFVAQVWVSYPNNKHFLVARNDMIIRIKKAFDKEGITIPFPIRTIEMSGGKNDG